MLFSFLFLSFVSYGFYVSQFEFNFFSEKNSNQQTLFNNYRLHLNIFSINSIGSGSSEVIAEEAKNANSNFVVLTDINTTTSFFSDKYISGVAMLYGAKIIDENQKNYSVYSIHNEKTDNVIKIVHFNTDLLKPSVPNKDNRDGYDIINLKNIMYKSWKDNKLSTIWSLLIYPFNPKLALIRLYQSPEQEISFFDYESKNRKTNLYLSSEATAKAIPMANWLIKFPSYYHVLSLASMRLLIANEIQGDINKDSQRSFDALKSGSFYISLDTVGDSTGFEVYAHSNKDNIYTMGSAIDLTKNLKIFFKLPHPPSVFHEVILYKNGLRIDHQNSSSGNFLIKDKGVYRIEVRLSTPLPLPDATRWIPWVYTNNFYVR